MEQSPAGWMRGLFHGGKEAVLKLMSANHYAFPANIEYEYPGGDAVSEVQKCYEFCRNALSS